jgi:hypothetical protein
MPRVRIKTESDFIQEYGRNFRDNIRAGWSDSMDDIFGLEFFIDEHQLRLLRTGEYIRNTFPDGDTWNISEDMFMVVSENGREGGSRMKEPVTVLADPSWIRQVINSNEDHKECILEWKDELDKRFKTYSSHTTKSEIFKKGSCHFNSSMTSANKAEFIRMYRNRRVTVHPVVVEQINNTSTIFDTNPYHRDVMNSMVMATLDGSCNDELEPVHLFTMKFTDSVVTYGFYDPLEDIGVFSDLTHYSRKSNALSNTAMNHIFSVIPERYSPSGEVVERIQVKLGTDPEFELLNNNGEVVNASSYLSNIDSTKRGISPSYTAGNCEIGTDGCSSTLELRPAPGSPEEVVGNLASLIKKLNKDYGGAHVSIKGDVRAIGCHIHFGIGKSFEPPRELLLLLDLFIGKPSLAHNGTARGSYGRVSSYESKPWGFEYRTPPASIMYSPEIFRIILKVGNLIVSKYMNLEPIKFYGVRHALFRDYVLLGLTKQEAVTLMTFFNKRKTKVLAGSVTQFWTDDYTPIKELKKVALEFTGDDWSSASKSYFARELQKLISTLDVKRNMTLVFYGLKRERGDLIICLPSIVAHPSSISQIDFEATHRGTTFKEKMNPNYMYIGLSQATRCRDNTSLLGESVKLTFEYLKVQNEIVEA